MFSTKVDRWISPEMLEFQSSPVAHRRLDKTLHDIEVCLLDPSSWIPGWSMATGVMEVVLGLVMVIVSIGASLKESAQGFFTTANVVQKEKHYRQASYDLKYAAHGLSHLVRGIINIIPIVGNAALFIYDRNTRYKYPTEK